MWWAIKVVTDSMRMTWIHLHTMMLMHGIGSDRHVGRVLRMVAVLQLTVIPAHIIYKS